MPKRIVSENEIRELLDGLDMGLGDINEDSSVTEEKRNPKEVFKDSVNPFDYVELDSTAIAFDKIMRVIEEPLKIVLIYGSPGTGKSMFLSRLHNHLKAQKKTSVHISTPILSEDRLFQTIAFEIYRYLKTEDIPINFNTLYDKLLKQDEYPEERKPLILLDEAQLYSDNILEQIRLLADTQTVKIVAVIHQLDKENIFNKEHFRSRIWQKIQLHNATRNELKVYIQKKLMNASLLSLANQFTPKTVKIIHKITGGNYRITNKLLYTIFDNYGDTLLGSLHEKPKKLSRKMIEVSAIKESLISVKNIDEVKLKHTPTVEKLWRKIEIKRFFKYSLYLTLPATLYLLYTHFEDRLEPTDLKESREKSYPENREEKEVKKLIITQESNGTSSVKILEESKEKEKIPVIPNAKDRQAIFESNESIDFDEDGFLPVLFNDDYKHKDISDEENESVDLVELFSIDGSLKNRSMVESNDSLSVENILEAVETNSTKYEKPKLEKVKKIERNLPIKKDKINHLFKKPLVIIPMLNQFTESEIKEVLDIKNREESKDIERLKNRFYEVKSIDTGLKLIKHYKESKDSSELLYFSYEVNRLDLNLTEPYIAISEALLDINETKLSDMIIERCKNCPPLENQKY